MRQDVLNFGARSQEVKKKVILEEYVDGIHFILSLGLEKKLLL